MPRLAAPDRALPRQAPPYLLKCVAEGVNGFEDTRQFLITAVFRLERAKFTKSIFQNGDTIIFIRKSNVDSGELPLSLRCNICRVDKVARLFQMGGRIDVNESDFNAVDNVT